MSVDPEPRQRTVAELLAENGSPQSGRRRRRRAAEDDAPFEDGPPVDGRSAPPAPPAPPQGGPAPQANGRFAGGYAPEPQGPPQGGAPNGYEQNGFDANGYGPNGYGPAPNGYAAGGPAPNGYAGPNGYDRNGYAPEEYAPPPAFPGPNGAPPPQARQAPPAPAPGRRAAPEPSPPAGMPQTPGPYGPADRRPPEPEPESPTGAFGARPPAAFGGPPPDAEGGPPTQLGAPPLDDDALDDIDQRAWTGELADDQGRIDATAPRRAAMPADGGPPTQAGYAPDDLDDIDDLDDEYEDHGERAAGLEDEPEYRRPSRRRTAVAGLDDGDLPDEVGDGKAAGTGQAWAMVIAQWVGGAVVGAGVWVGFRFLWYSLPVVALSLAVVLTVGLVLGVRALLRNDDLRTTMFAVLVGLLLTVSPALLVLLDR